MRGTWTVEQAYPARAGHQPSAALIINRRVYKATLHEMICNIKVKSLVCKSLHRPCRRNHNNYAVEINDVNIIHHGRARIFVAGRCMLATGLGGRR